MGKICCIFNVPALYRESIYRKIDNIYDCDWYFENAEAQLQQFDTKILKNVNILQVSWFKRFYIVKGLINLLRKEKYTSYFMIGHTRNVSGLFFLLLKKLIFRNKRVYLWTHGYYGKETRLELIWKRFMFKSADGIFLYGNYARNLMLKDRFNPEKLHVIHNSLNYDEQILLRNSMKETDIYKKHFGNKYPNVLFIGRLTPIKRLDMLVNALAILKEKGENYNLIIVGDGSMQDSLERQVRIKGLCERVWFYGSCFDEATNAELIYNADLCVAPGNIGLTAIHALMFGCPCLSHDNYPLQMPEFEAINDGITGTFYKHNDQQSLANTISFWFKQNTKKRDEVRQACYHEIDTKWNPNFQMNVINSVIRE